MPIRFRNLALTCPEAAPHEFVWLILESVDDATVWHTLETFKGEVFANWDDAWNAGSAALREYLRAHSFNFKAKPLL